MQSGKVVLACVLGAFVGALMGLHFGHLWVSILSGGIVGFLSYEAPVVIAATPRAWVCTINWRLDFSWMPNFLKAWGMSAGLVFNFLLIGAVWLAHYSSSHFSRFLSCISESQLCFWW